MGSKGQKPRKKSHSQHLPKVGTPAENERLLHEERAAVLDNVGLGGASPWIRFLIGAFVVMMLASAVLAMAHL